MKLWGRAIARGLLLGGVVVGVGAAAGCFASGPVRIEPRGTAYEGPAVALVDRDGQHQVVVSAPSPGWTVTMDRQTIQRGATRVFLTLRRPNPEMLYAQQVVEQRLATGVDEAQGIEVLVRVLDFDRDSGPYVIVHAQPSDSQG